MKQITKEQRYQIEAYLKVKMSINFIAKELGKHPISIRREIKRNSQKRGTYRAKYATMLAKDRKDRFDVPRKFNYEVEKRVRQYLEQEQWSPEQIVGYCVKNDIPIVSHERIYQYLREDKNKGGQLYKNLRHQLKHRKRAVSSNNIRIKDRISIDQRPEKANNREEFGHFEMDLVVGKENKGAILTITERKSRQFFCRFLPHGKIAKHVSKAIIEELLPYKKHVLSITTDNGTEFADHKTVASKLNTIVYFAHPYSSWEKGQIEYCNKLLRQYIPKKSIINEHNTLKLKEIQRKINRRPRKNLNFEKPFKLFYNFINQNVAFAS